MAHLTWAHLQSPTLNLCPASSGQDGSFGLDSGSESEEETGKALRKKGTSNKDPGKHESGVVASAQRYVPPAARGSLMQGEHACTSSRLTTKDVNVSLSTFVGTVHQFLLEHPLNKGA